MRLYWAEGFEEQSMHFSSQQGTFNSITYEQIAQFLHAFALE
jgi:hypothetical protein